MKELTVANKQGLELTITQNEPEDYIPIMGGDSSNPSWKEYLSNYKNDFKPHIQLIKKGIKEMGWIGMTAENIANDWCFVFSDGTAIGFSWRAWGDLMQAIVNQREGYMKYYM